MIYHSGFVSQTHTFDSGPQASFISKTLICTLSSSFRRLRSHPSEDWDLLLLTFKFFQKLKFVSSRSEDWNSFQKIKFQGAGVRSSRSLDRTIQSCGFLCVCVNSFSWSPFGDSVIIALYLCLMTPCATTARAQAKTVSAGDALSHPLS